MIGRKRGGGRTDLKYGTCSPMLQLQSGSTGFPHHHGCREAGPSPGGGSRVRCQNGNSGSGGERPRSWAPEVRNNLCSFPRLPSRPLRERRRESRGRVTFLLSFLCHLLGALYNFWDRPRRRAEGSLQRAAFVRTADGKWMICTAPWSPAVVVEQTACRPSSSRIDAELPFVKYRQRMRRPEKPSSVFERTTGASSVDSQLSMRKGYVGRHEADMEFVTCFHGGSKSRYSQQLLHRRVFSQKYVWTWEHHNIDNRNSVVCRRSCEG